jgi:hypothetical protein
MKSMKTEGRLVQYLVSLACSQCRCRATVQRLEAVKSNKQAEWTRLPD